MALLFLIEVARHVQSTQNRNLVIFVQYLRKNNVNEVYFLYADKHESFLQVDTNILAKQNFTCVIKCFSGISEKWDPRLETFGVTQDPRPKTHLTGGTHNPRPGTLKVGGPKTQEPGKGFSKNFHSFLWCLSFIIEFMCFMHLFPGIYPSNFDVHYTTQKTKSFNWVFKLKFSKHFGIEILFKIYWLTRFLLF